MPRGFTRHTSGKVRTQVRVNGKQVVRVFDTLTAAQEWREAAQDAIKRGAAIPEPSRARFDAARRYMTIPDLMGEWHADYRRERTEHLTPRTITLHERQISTHLLPFFGARRVNEITRDDVRAFRDHLAGQGYSKSWQGRLLWLLSAGLDYARATGVIDANPAHKVLPVAPSKPRKKVGKARVVTIEETAAMTRVVGDSFRVGFWVQRLCGLRISELFGLHLDDIDRAARVLRVRRQGGKDFTDWQDGKAVVVPEVDRLKTDSGARIVGIPDVLMDLLDVYIARHHADSAPTDRLMRMPEGGRSSGSYASALRRAATRLDVTDSAGNPVTSHVLRKSLLTDLEDLGVPQLVRSIVAGHKVGAYDGGASITAGTYTLTTGKVKEIREAAAKVDQRVREALGDDVVLDVSAEVDHPTGEWVYAPKAARELGITVRVLGDYVRAGTLTARTHKNPNQHSNALYISRGTLDALVRARAERVTIAKASRMLDLSDGTVTRLAQEHGIPVTYGRDGHDRAWFDLDGYERLAALVGASKAFTDTHYSSTQVMDVLGVPRKTIYSLRGTGWIEEVDPQGAVIGSISDAQAAWFTRESVDAALAAKATWWRNGRKAPNQTPVTAPEGYLSPVDAAALIGISDQTVRQLAAEGALEATRQGGPGNQRVWITHESAVRYRDGNRRALRREAREKTGAAPESQRPPSMSRGRVQRTVAQDERLAAEWHPIRNDGLDPAQVSVTSHGRAWWLGTCGHEWDAPVRERAKGRGYCRTCPRGHTVAQDERLAAEWHPTRNDGLDPAQVTTGSGRRAWWVCGSGHEWEAAINNRSRTRKNGGSGCPECANLTRGPRPTS